MSKAINLHMKVVLAILASSISLISESGIVPSRAQNTSVKLNPLPSEYWDAVEDARTPEPQEVFRNLTAITRSNKTLVWDNRDRVLVATWATWGGYAPNQGKSLILTQELWVTAVPDLKNFCRSYTPTPTVPLATRLNQLLGLPPDERDRAANRRIVEIWIDPTYLFRPSFDPEITDHEAEVGFRSLSEFISVPLSYQQWFYAQYDQRYQDKGQPIDRNQSENQRTPYPWTQLGYTYDWGNPADWSKIDPNRPKRVGLSEFVIRQWSPISIHSVRSMNDYCSKSTH
jgi:hypothetical protein